MDTENPYETVKTPEQHVVYVAMRQAARELREGLTERRLRAMTLADLEKLIDELSQLVAQKAAREREYATMTSEELSALLNVVAAEIKRRKSPPPQKPKPSGLQPTISRASESAPPPQRGELTDLSGPIDVRVEKRDVRVERL